MLLMLTVRSDQYRRFLWPRPGDVIAVTLRCSSQFGQALQFTACINESSVTVQPLSPVSLSSSRTRSQMPADRRDTH